MQTTTLAALLGVAIIVACSVDRPSEDLNCSTTPDCAGLGGNRQCVGGYCVVPNCPDDCTSCDELAKTCQVDCTSAADCGGTITCPNGWSCTVSCVGDGACNDVQCESGSTCAITCSGDNACGDIQCSSACQCDLECVGAACGSKSCPVVGNGANQVRCTSDGTATTQCDSAHAAGCTKC